MRSRSVNNRHKRWKRNLVEFVMPEMFDLYILCNRIRQRNCPLEVLSRTEIWLEGCLSFSGNHCPSFWPPPLNCAAAVNSMLSSPWWNLRRHWGRTTKHTPGAGRISNEPSHHHMRGRPDCLSRCRVTPQGRSMLKQLFLSCIIVPFSPGPWHPTDL